VPGSADDVFLVAIVQWLAGVGAPGV